MAIEDYIPNVFSAPLGYEGLLGAEQSKKLEGRANIQGLLGAAGALAQGLGSQGPRRSALQNILGAISGGMQSSQGAYQQGIQNYSQQQQMQQANILRGDIAKVMQMPEVANNPALIASLRSDPAGTLKWINENMGISQAYAPAAAPAMPQVQGQEPVVEGANVLPAVNVTAQANPLLAQKDRLMLANTRLTGMPGATAQKAIESNLKQIENIDKQLKTEFDIEQKQKDYTNEARRVAAALFPNMSLEDLNPQQLTQLQTKLDQLEIAKRKAGATNVSLSTDQGFGTQFGKGVADSVFNTLTAAQGAQSTLSTIQSIKPIIQSGVYSGPLSSVPRFVNQLSVAMGIPGKDDNERLKNTAVAMQGLASLELSAAQGMKGQGAITEAERGLIKRAAAGDLQTFTQPEVLALLNAMEKTSKSKINAHERNLSRLKNRPDTSGLADFYLLDQSAPSGTPVKKYNPATGKIE